MIKVAAVSGKMRLAAYLALFVASVAMQGGLSSASPYTGVVAQFQVVISVLITLLCSFWGFVVSFAANACLFVFLITRYFMLGDQNVLPGVVICASTVLVTAIIGKYKKVVGTQKDAILDGRLSLERKCAEAQAAEERAAFLATHDEATGLANERNLRNRLAGYVSGQALETGPCGVLLVKVENMRHISLVLGSRFAVAVLQALSKRIEPLLGQDVCLLSLFRHDTFAMLFADAVAMHKMSSDILGVLQANVVIKDVNVKVGVHAGAVVDDGRTGNAEQIMQCAELALLYAVRTRCAEVVVYDESVARAEKRRVEIIAALDGALANNEFSLVYQPQVDVLTGAIKGAEALLRWNSRNLGSVSPGEFIPLAEETQHIATVGRWILDQACKDASQWPEQWTVSVNISTVQLLNDDFKSHISGALSRANLDPQRLKLEITESIMIDDMEFVNSLLSDVKKLMVRVVLDDFGSGFSSLSYIKNIHLDELKIDKTFTQSVSGDKRSQGVLKAIVRLADELGLTITAEGVETQCQAELLANLGFHRLQGFLYGRPMHTVELLKLVVQ